MSLTSYRAAPPRGGGGEWDGSEDLAATYSPAAWAAVPWALGVFTAEFGMGSGAGPPQWPPGRPARPHQCSAINHQEDRGSGACMSPGGDRSPGIVPGHGTSGVAVSRPLTTEPDNRALV